MKTNLDLENLREHQRNFEIYVEYLMVLNIGTIKEPKKKRVPNFDRTNFRSNFLFNRTTKKSSYPSVFFLAFLQTAVIDKSVPALFENAGIGNPITTVQNQRFIKRCNRRPIAAFFKNAGIGSPKTLG